VSDTAQGPGWWLASDDKWYPPELHPDAVAARTATPPPAAEQPPAWSPPAQAGYGPPAQAGYGPPAQPGWAGPPAQPGWAGPPAQPGWAGPPAQPGYGPPAGPATPNHWEDSPWTQGSAPVVVPATRAPRKRIGKRPLLIVGVVIAIVVVAAVAVPLGLRKPSKPALTLTAAALVARSLVAARGSTSVELQVLEQGGSQFARETMDFAAHGASMNIASGSVGSTSVNALVEVVGTSVYFRGPASFLSTLGVSSLVAAKHVAAWVSMSRSDAGLLISQLSQRLEVDMISLTDVTKNVSGSVVSLQGDLPRSILNPTSATPTRATLTLSANAPYFPSTLTFSGSGDSVTYTYSKWGSSPAVMAPTATTSLASLLADSSRGLIGDQAILQGISVSQSDVPGSNTVGLIGDGDQVTGQVTLDLCSRTYATERLRVARRQVAVIPAGSSPGTFGNFSTEAVMYTSAAATATAFAEMRYAATTCPAGFVVPAEGPPAVKTTLTPPADSSWPSVAGLQRLVFRVSVNERSEPAQTHWAIYVRRGRILLGIYLNGTSTNLTFPIDGQHSLAGIVNVLAKRLAALPPADVR
jgi:hypothetical protein